MPRTRPPYPQKFRNQIVELARNGRTPSDLADEFEPTETTTEIGSSRPIETREKAPRACLPTNKKSFASCVRSCVS